MIAAKVPLAPRTSFGLGGAAEHFVQVDTREALLDALRWAKARALAVTILGGGSNVVINDEGVSGLVIAIATQGIARDRSADGARVIVRAEAGESWDALVAACIEDRLAGLECLSGIPGRVGATPIQNVGAYGQEVSDVITEVELLDRASLAITKLPAAACGFAYRHSRFKQDPSRYVVLGVSFALLPDGAPAIRYAELARALAGSRQTPTLRETRETVLSLRASKSMLLDPSDENGRSAGSFFTNPIVSTEQAEAVIARAIALGVARDPSEVPRFPQPDGRIKLAAGWLIERAGVRKGERGPSGHVGVSTRHALSLVHLGGGSARELIAFAESVQARVREGFGIALTPEPVFLGF